MFKRYKLKNFDFILVLLIFVFTVASGCFVFWEISFIDMPWK